MKRYVEIGNKIKSAREQRGLTQKELGIALNCSEQAIGNYEAGRRKISIEDLEKIAKILNKPISYFLGEKTGKKNPPDLSALRRETAKYLDDFLDIVFLPVIGTIAAGLPILAEENISDYLPFPKFISNRASLALRVKGDSMIEKNIDDGDYVFIRLQDVVNNGDIAAILILDGAEQAEATLKIFYDEGNGKVRLKSANQKYEDIVIDKGKVRIVGKYAGIFKPPD